METNNNFDQAQRIAGLIRVNSEVWEKNFKLSTDNEAYKAQLKELNGKYAALRSENINLLTELQTWKDSNREYEAQLAKANKDISEVRNFVDFMHAECVTEEYLTTAHKLAQVLGFIDHVTDMAESIEEDAKYCEVPAQMKDIIGRLDLLEHEVGLDERREKGWGVNYTVHHALKDHGSDLTAIECLLFSLYGVDCLTEKYLSNLVSPEQRTYMEGGAR